jgi:hypothetical protein
MNYFCHSCGFKNPYVNGLKPKFCTNCGVPSDVSAAKTKPAESKTAARPTESQGSGDWRDEWKAKPYASGGDEDIDLNEVMRGLKRDNGVSVEKSKMLTIADLKEMESFDGRGDAPQGGKDMAAVRGEIMKNLGVAKD